MSAGMTDAQYNRQVADDPADLGLDPDAIAEVVARAQREIDEGHVPSCQIAFARATAGLLLRLTLGEAAPESRYVIFSATKPVVAAAMWILMGEGAIDVTRRVAEIVPEFGTNGKDVITIEQVMLHTSGSRARRSSRSSGTTANGGWRASRSGAATGSPGRGSSTTRRRRTGCSPS